MSVLALLLLTTPLAQDTKCAATQPASLKGPMVRDEDAARAIFIAVTDQFAGGEDFSAAQVIVDDSPDHRKWIVFHYVPGQRGGGMAMKIDKCTGAISDVHNQR